MYHCKGRFSILVELNSGNDKELFDLIIRNIDEYRRLVSDQVLPDCYTEFIDTIKQWFRNGRLYQFVAYSIGKNIPIGTIFFYSLNQDDSSVKMSVFFEKSVRGRVVVAESLALAVVFALNIIKVQNIKFSVYPENLYMMNLAKKLKCVDCDTVNKQRNIKVFLLSSETISKILIVLGRLYR